MSHEEMLQMFSEINLCFWYNKRKDELVYYNKALNRINRVNWLQLGMCKDKQRMGFEYLCRMAGFVEEQSIKPINPLFINIAKILGDEKETSYEKSSLI